MKYFSESALLKTNMVLHMVSVLHMGWPEVNLIRVYFISRHYWKGPALLGWQYQLNHISDAESFTAWVTDAPWLTTTTWNIGALTSFSWTHAVPSNTIPRGRLVRKKWKANDWPRSGWTNEKKKRTSVNRLLAESAHIFGTSLNTQRPLTEPESVIALL